jgi:hypothetical protein
MVAAFQALVSCVLRRTKPFEENEAPHPGQFREALRVYMEMTKSRESDVNDTTLAPLHEIRVAPLDE